MRITKIEAYQVDLPLHEGAYKWSGGKFVEVFDSTIVRVETDAGVVGHGEVCPLGPAYLPAYASGARAGMQELLPELIGRVDLIVVLGQLDLVRGMRSIEAVPDVDLWIGTWPGVRARDAAPHQGALFVPVSEGDSLAKLDVHLTPTDLVLPLSHERIRIDESAGEDERVRALLDAAAASREGG